MEQALFLLFICCSLLLSTPSFSDEEEDLNNRARNLPNWNLQPYSFEFIAVLIFLHCTTSTYLLSVSAEHNNMSGTVEGIR